MKNLFVTLLFWLLVCNANSQNINFEIKTGYGFYKLNEIKSLQSSMLQAANLPNSKAVEEFPSNIFYSLSANYLLNEKSGLGLNFSYFTTGGRNHLADYSGEYKLDMLLNGYRLGTKYRHNITPTQSKLDVALLLEGGVLFSDMRIDEKLRVYTEENITEEIKLTSTGLYVEPSFSVAYNLLKRTNINFSCGYEFDFKGELHLKDDNIGTSTNWSGLRVSFGINYTIEFNNQ